MSENVTPAPEGETPNAGPCAKCGGLSACWCGMPSTPTPAPASGEEELAWLRIRDVRQPQSGKSRCCGTWELVEPALLIAVRERDWILEAFARLTRELAEARKTNKRLNRRAQEAEERETLATGLDTRAEALAHGHGVAGNIDGMSDEEFERRMKAAGKGCTVCARIELLSECAAALRASQEGENG